MQRIYIYRSVFALPRLPRALTHTRCRWELCHCIYARLRFQRGNKRTRKKNVEKNEKKKKEENTPTRRSDAHIPMEKTVDREETEGFWDTVYIAECFNIVSP